MCPGREREREREGGKERDGERERVCVCVCEGERKAGKRGSACVSIPRYARNSYGKRDLIIRQKRPIHTAKEAYSYGLYRDTPEFLMAKGLFLWQKFLMAKFSSYGKNFLWQKACSYGK